MDFIESCRKLISLDSTPSQGNSLVAKQLAELATAMGLDVELIEEHWADVPQCNLLISPKGPFQNEIEEMMLQTHLDTSDPGPFGLWTQTEHNPFDAHIVDGKIFGIGVADTKLDFLCKLVALSSFSNEKNWKRKPVLVGTYGEEIGMMGSLKLIRKNKIKAKWALVGEPSNLQLISSGKGMAAVEIRIPFEQDEKSYRVEHNLKESTSSQSRIFNGKSAHSSTPHLGESAIKKMLEYLMQLPDDLTVIEIDGGVNFNTVPANAFLDLDLVSGYKVPMARKLIKIYKAICDLEDEFLQFQDESFKPSHPTLNIGIIRTFDDHVFISGNCRIPPIVTTETYENWMKKLSVVCQSVGAEFRVSDYKRPYRTSSESEFVVACQDELRKLNGKTSLVTQPSTNEASLYSRVGIECICFGPGKREGNIHTPQEHVKIEDLHFATDFYRNMIKRFCL